jgi:hypothetical protein
MAVKKKTTTKKKPAKKSTAKRITGGIASYVRKIQNSVGVKKVTNTIKEIEKKLALAKKKKAAAVKLARKKLK